MSRMRNSNFNLVQIIICFVTFVILLKSQCQACQCLDFAHCCYDRIETDRIVCKNNTLRCLDSSFQDRRCDRAKSLESITCPDEKCAASDYWCEERQDCINKDQVCDCGPGKAYCLENKLYEPKYRCVDRAVVGSGRFDFSFCPDGSCSQQCKETSTAEGCPKGEIQCGPDCKNETEIVDFRSCESRCVPSEEFCYLRDHLNDLDPPEPEPQPTGLSTTGLVVLVLILILVVVACCVGLFLWWREKAEGEKRKIEEIEMREREEERERKERELYDAVDKNNDEQVRSLLESKVNPNIAGPDRDGSYPLHLAAKQGNSSITSLLLLHGAEVDQHNNKKNTPLAMAAQWGKVEVARQLLSKGANVNNQMDSGWTPLHAAVTQNHKDMVLLLCEEKADLTLRATCQRVDKSGGKMNPLELARKQGLNEIGDILQAMYLSRLCT